MRTIAIGDIHGCSEALEGLLDALQPSTDDTLVFLGDYVDRGPDSQLVIDRLIGLQNLTNTIFLRGNHDLVMQQWCEGFLDRELWELIGGASTLQSYGVNDPAMIPPSHLDFLVQCRNFHETDTHIFVHGGYQSNLPLEKTSLECLMWCHLGWPLPKPHVSGKTVIVGHTPQTLGMVADFGHLVCIDTYCFGGGNLTAYDVDAKTALQVDFHGRLVRNWNGISQKGWFGKMMSWLSMPRANASCRQKSDQQLPVPKVVSATSVPLLSLL